MIRSNPCHDISAIRTLIEQSLEEARTDNASFDAQWCLMKCHSREAFEEIKALCYSDDVLKRSTGIGLFAQYGRVIHRGSSVKKDSAFLDEKLAIMLDIFEQETEHDVLESLGYALGHLESPDVIEPLIILSCHVHEDIRFAATMGFYLKEDNRAIQTLLRLMNDADSDVRDWATFGIGVRGKDLDTPEVREALFQNINDPDEDTRYEALSGLALRRDRRIVPILLQELTDGTVDIDTIPGSEFCEMLEDLKDEVEDVRLQGILEEWEQVKAEQDKKSINFDASPTQRARQGRDINNGDGDPRYHIGLVKSNGVPDIGWCTVVEGEFIFGGDSYVNEAWQRQTVTLDYDYHISIYPITNAQFAPFLADYFNTRWWDGLDWQPNEPPPTLPEPFSEPNHPRVLVSWNEAVAYTRWLSEQLEFEVRLPTEYEWEKAARGSDGLIFPYGNEFNPIGGNTLETGIGSTCAVGLFPEGESPYGVQDMSGNVWEWCITEWRLDLSEPENNSVEGNVRRCLRGGSWDFDQRFARATYRNWNEQFVRNPAYGFRVVTLYNI